VALCALLDVDRERSAVDVVLIAYGCALGWVCWEIPRRIDEGKLLLMMKPDTDDDLDGDGEAAAEGGEGEGG